MVNPDHERTYKCVEHFRQLGLCPLPSREDRKGPALKQYAQYYGPTRVSEYIYDNWATTNIQLITGVKSSGKSKILVVDCDGEEALPVWEAICQKNGSDPAGTWVSRTGSGGYHFYFSLPASLEACPSGILWAIWDTWGDDGRGKWIKHKEIRLLGDHALVIAPPSIHVDTGDRYEFAPSANPNRIELPVMAPDWLIQFPRLVTPKCYAEPVKSGVVINTTPSSGNFYGRDEVLAAIGDRKLDVAKDWGLVVPFPGTPNPGGWVNCFVPNRENPRYSRPSGSFHYKDGTLQDRKTMSTLSFFDLGVELGKYLDWRTCRDDLGDKFIGKRK